LGRRLVKMFIIVGWLFFFSSRRRHTRFSRDWSSDVCSSDLPADSLGDEEFVLVLERAGSGEVRGTCQMMTQVGQQWPFYSYRLRSEERRVGKEGRIRWLPEQDKKKLRETRS